MYTKTVPFKFKIPLKGSYKINFDILEQLRGLAAFYVVLNHARANLFAGGSKLAEVKPVAQWSFLEKLYISGLQVTTLGHEFVILFFLISGLSIAHSFSGSANTLPFMRRRLIRIYPTYLVGLAWAYFVYFTIRQTSPQWLMCIQEIPTSSQLCDMQGFASVRTLLKNLVYLPEGYLISQYWSLTQEVIFYLLIPLFFLNLRWYLILSALAYATGFAFQGIHVSDNNHVIDYSLYYNFFFAVGILLFLNVKKLHQPLIRNKFLFLAMILFIFLLMVGEKFYLGGNNKITDGLAVVFSIALINYFLSFKVSINVLKWLGQHSYTLYVTHFASLFLFKALLASMADYDGGFIYNKWTWIAGSLFATVVSYCLFHLAEKPSIQYLKRLRRSASKGSKAAAHAEAA